MEDKIEATQECVEECAMLIRELLDEYNCVLGCDFDQFYVTNGDSEPPFYEVEL